MFLVYSQSCTIIKIYFRIFFYLLKETPSSSFPQALSYYYFLSLFLHLKHFIYTRPLTGHWTPVQLKICAQLFPSQKLSCSSVSMGDWFQDSPLDTKICRCSRLLCKNGIDHSIQWVLPSHGLPSADWNKRGIYWKKSACKSIHSVQICINCNSITQYVILCDWLLSLSVTFTRFICFTYSTVSFLFNTK